MTGSDAKVVVVTGASRGIGRGIARGFGAAGYRVVLAARDAAALEEAAAEARAAGAPDTLCLPGDLREADRPAAVVEAAARFGRLDAVISNAGATKRGDFLTLTDDDMLDGFALKYHAAVRLCRAAWPHLRASGGSIVGISGIGAHTPTAEFTIGAPVNAAVIAFMKALADRGRAEGVRVNTICPGAIATERLHRRIATLAARDGLSLEAAEEAMRRDMGVSRFGSPDDIAAMAVFLCSDQGAYVHGATIDVDGGIRPGV